MNNWDDQQKAAFLATGLKGTALSVLGHLPQEKRQNYNALVDALASRFGTAHRTELSSVPFKNRIKQREESLPALAEDVERLSRLSYLNAPSTIQDVLARDQFIDALPDDEITATFEAGAPINTAKSS